jgi:hypothetical protein
MDGKRIISLHPLLYFSFFVLLFCSSKKNVLVNDDEKGSSEKHYPGEQANWQVRQGTVGNRSDKVHLEVSTSNVESPPYTIFSAVNVFVLSQYTLILFRDSSEWPLAMG